ncbi:peptidoglycan DD-metalloendopeptidase family protein [Larsenimonas salina]|uniref:peptidoglycan DD-metalloendopeptidase family protein n=1 Tax=Larsenimonas salina TaxID=1295565 RepID=UPI002074881F|nr:peptidoglycan DD-metalloendopeptidase family protein [Larsenimonas salina]MCM5703839.1 peptidoglycan DD-metalloendopeptidase family protein [Larsenimonas salina]
MLLPAVTVVTVLGTHTLVAGLENSDTESTVDVQPIELAATESTNPPSSPAPQMVTPLPMSVPLFSEPVRSDISTSALEFALSLQTDAAQKILPSDSSFAEPFDLEEDASTLEGEIAATEQYVPEWQSYTVQPGDSFTIMAERNFGLGYGDVIKILNTLPDKKVLTRLRVGHDLYYKLDRAGNLIALKVMKNAREGYLLDRSDADQAFTLSNVTQATQATQRMFAGTVEGSFGASALATGLSSAEVSELTKALGKKINFRKDTRQGDRFQVLVESEMIDGRPLASRILAARYEGKRLDLSIVRHDDTYYTPTGKSLDPSFERYPFNGHHRVSSPFNLRRHHPVTGRISPHYGTDFAMKTGTPIEAAGAGRVTKVVNHALAGLYVVITHDNGYKTRYLHLSRSVVRPGQRVKMGQKIAYSGNSGRTTGPHLHYEVIVNNHRVNPMRVKLPGGTHLKGSELASFKKRSQTLLTKLDNADNSKAVAKRTRKESDNES